MLSLHYGEHCLGFHTDGLSLISVLLHKSVHMSEVYIWINEWMDGINEWNSQITDCGCSHWCPQCESGAATTKVSDWWCQRSLDTEWWLCYCRRKHSALWCLFHSHLANCIEVVVTPTMRAYVCSRECKTAIAVKRFTHMGNIPCQWPIWNISIKRYHSTSAKCIDQWYNSFLDSNIWHTF